MLVTVAFAIAGLGAGCFELDQTVALAPDGAIACTLHYSIDADLVPQAREFHILLQQWQGADRDGTLQWAFSEEAAERYFGEHGVTVESYAQYEQGGRRHVVVECIAPDGAAALGSGAFGDFELVHDPGTNATTVRTVAMISTEDVDPDVDPAAFETLREATRGMRLRLEIRTPAPITAATGRKISEHRVEWLFDADADPGFLTAPPGISVTFAGPPPALAPDVDDHQ